MDKILLNNLPESTEWLTTVIFFKTDNPCIKNFGIKPIKIFSTFYDLSIDLLPEKNKYW